jgi:hypothetical protein
MGRRYSGTPAKWDWKASFQNGGILGIGAGEQKVG